MRLSRHGAGLLVVACAFGGCRTSAPPPSPTTVIQRRAVSSRAATSTPVSRPGWAFPSRSRRSGTCAGRRPSPSPGRASTTPTARCRQCIQVLRPHNINHYFGEEPTSEDCLYMNIWAPSDATPASRLPVIVFIYGGGGTIGSSGMANYDGEQVARRGAVFVNFNYRVGILGFMAHPELTQGAGRPLGQLRLPRSERGADVDSAQHRRVRRRPGEGHHLGPVGRRRVGRAADLQPALDAACSAAA